MEVARSERMKIALPETDEILKERKMRSLKNEKQCIT